MGFLLTGIPWPSSPLPPVAAVLPQAAKRCARCLRGATDQCGSLRFFLLHFEKGYATLARTKAPFCRCSCPLRVTVVRVGVDRTTSCTDGSLCRSTRLLAIGHCSTQPLAQPGVWFQVRAPATRSVAGARCRRLHPFTSRGPSEAGTWSVPHPVPHTLRRRGARCMMVA